MDRMKYRILSEKKVFTGEEMRPHWAYINYDLLGDSIVAFTGTFQVPRERLIDIKYIKEGMDILSGEEMLHLVVEHFQENMTVSVLRQYLLLSIVEEKLSHRTQNEPVIRWGDDLYYNELPISTTATTKTMVSCKIHLGLFLHENKLKGHTGLDVFGIDPFEMVEVIIGQYRAEIKRLCEKAYKMRPVL